MELAQAKAQEQAMQAHLEEVGRLHAAVVYQLQHMHTYQQATEDDQCKVHQEIAALKKLAQVKFVL